jgi:hypothetical protein
MDILLIIKYIFIGILCAYLLIYGLRPSIPYPDSILEFYENTWLLLLIIILNFYVYKWDRIVGILLCLSIIALILDMIQFTN